ncbi:DUF6292 family protein [Actinomadura oligospora]|uniref:DUF6292 family protein n=1 Tax=Actinomadura oligospora TaxID=111804 RepID=UPI0004BA8896|nr:DUF6292 family protein [Actinomadura oligospora]
MAENVVVKPHEDAKLDVFRPYLTESVRALEAAGVEPTEAWLDPCGPRDATIVLGSRALVWDEESGWRVGGFVKGEPGVRTQLEDARYLGGGVLIEPAEVAERMAAGTSEPYRRFRAHEDDPESLDAEVRARFS